MCVARLRVAVGAGIWRANHKTLGAWAERAYPEGHLIDTRRKPGSPPHPPRTSRCHTQSH